MSSSDSDDDCYGNVAQKLQILKSKYKETNDDSTVLNETSEVCKTSDTLPNNDNISVIAVEDCNITLNSTDNDEFSLDAIIANNSKGRSCRSRGAKRKVENSDAGRVTRSSRRKTANSTRGRTSPFADPVPDVDTTQPSASSTSSRRSNSTRVRGSRGRNRGASTATPRGRGRGSRSRQMFHEIVNFLQSNVSNLQSIMDYPTYSVGNTDEYPDQCDNQELFSTRTTNNDVEVIETDPLEEDNEELSVKVYWQSLEVFKFKIRKYQKISQIFEYFAEKEGVNYDKLLFTYNDRILKKDDTPDSVNYSIAKFIEGGIVNQNVTELMKKKETNTVNNGIKIKFQCQNVKKPYETRLRPEDKLALAMMKCAEHLEIPMERLKFYFDGDLLSSKSTPQELELEGGECIDVKICT